MKEYFKKLFASLLAKKIAGEKINKKEIEEQAKLEALKKLQEKLE